MTKTNRLRTDFGVDLEFLLQREAGGSAIPLGTIPSIIEKCLLEVEARGLTEVGICKQRCSRLLFLDMLIAFGRSHRRRQLRGKRTQGCDEPR